MQKREKILLGLVVALVGILGLRYGYDWVGQQFERRQQRILALRKEVQTKEFQVLKGNKASQRMASYESRSLPSDRELARSLYQHWLIGLVDKAGLAGGVTSQAPRTQRGEFDRLSFTLNAQGTLTKVVQLLHSFYDAGHLHQVKSLTINPLQDGQKFDLMLAIEALALPRTENTTSLAEVASPRPRTMELAAYTKDIVDRNIFAPYKPPTPPVTVAPKPAPPAFDVAKHTKVSGIVSQNGQSQVWLSNRTTGEVLRLGEGSAFNVGNLSGVVERIGTHDIEIVADGQRLLLAIGESLREGSPLPEGDL
jgi:hypothetical protein